MNKPIILGVIDIPCPDDMVVAMHGSPEGTAAGTAIIDVRHVDDFHTIPIQHYYAKLRNIQLVCTIAQYDALVAYVSEFYARLTDPATLRDTRIRAGGSGGAAPHIWASVVGTTTTR